MPHLTHKIQKTRGLGMPFCNKCGNEEKPNDVFCSKCGVKFSSEIGDDPTQLSERGRRTLNNLKKGRRTRRYLCLECGYAGPAILVRKKLNWIAIGGAFILSVGLALVSAVSGGALAILCALTLILTTSYTLRCPRCEKESTRKGLNAYR